MTALAIMLAVWGVAAIAWDGWRRYLAHRAAEREALAWADLRSLSEDHEQRIADLERSRRDDSLARMGRSPR